MNNYKKKIGIVLAISILFSGQVFSGITFSNDKAKLSFKDWKSQIKFNSGVNISGWRDSSMVQRVSGKGLGDYNLKQYDYNFDNLITYSSVNNNMGAVDWNIPANEVVHIQENIYMDGYGGTINIGENSQLFVDDNVTLTLRNVTVISSKNGVGNPAIKLATPNSQLVLDNAKLDFANDFYFDHGQLFVYNDVNFTGTNGFIYRSTVPSYIKSGANLKFNSGTTFDFRPSTTGLPGLLGKDLLVMDDATSKITFDGATLKATLTGLRLTEGQVLFDNKVSLTSQAALRLADYTTTITGWVYHGELLGVVYGIAWHPSGRYVAVTGKNGARDLTLFSFSGTSLAVMGSTYDFGFGGYGVDWSPDGRYLALCGYSGLTIYSFNGTSLSQVANVNPTLVYSVKWNTSGKYLAITGNSGVAYVYSFNGKSLNLVASPSGSFSGAVFKTAWSPDGKYLAFLGTDTSNNFRVYEFTGSALNLVDQRYILSTLNAGDLVWSPDGHYIAVGVAGSLMPGYRYLNIFYFTGSKLALVTGLSSGSDVLALAWSADGGSLAVGFSTDNPDVAVYSFKDSTLTRVGSGFDTASYGAFALAWSPNENFLAIGSMIATRPRVEFNINSVVYGPETQTQAVSNSIVFGNSSLQPISLNSKSTSTWDLTVKLLSGANVFVDGILNIDNSPTNTNSVIFANDNSRFVLKDWKSKIRSNLNSMQGWRDSSIVPNVSGLGLGDYNIKQYDYNIDNNFTYSEVSNSMQYIDWNIPANTIVHVKENIYMDGYGGTINIGENSQLFVDDNVTLTLRNVTVSSSKNWVGNPAIKLSSNRSRLVLDNTKLNFANDFYFNRGSLFVYNDVNFTGTNGFIYCSTVPSYIKSGANLKFNNGTTFDFRPSTTGTPGLLAKDLLMMDDATSKITFDGASLKTTLTGMRLTNGQVIFDNKVSMTSQSQFAFKSLGSWIPQDYGTVIRSLNWSPDGRYLAVGGTGPTAVNEIQVYRFTGSALALVDSKDYGTTVLSVNWSPDGKYLAVGGGVPLSGNEIQVYAFSGSALSLVASLNYGTSSSYVYSVNWSPDGRYLAVGGYLPVSGNEIQLYRFSGLALSLVTSLDYGSRVFSLNWSPDGKFLAVGGWTPTSGNELQVYRFVGESLTLVASRDYSSTGYIYSLNWSPDGRFLALGGIFPTSGNEIQVYNFTGSALALVASQPYGSTVWSVNWSPDGRYLAVGGYLPTSGNETQIYKFMGSDLSLVDSINFGSDVYSVSWSADGKYLAVGGQTPDSGHEELDVYTLNYGPETQTQNISNSIMFGNSALQPVSLSSKITSTNDLTIKLLSGANVSVDGILNIDNSPTNTNSVVFSSDNSRFVLKDWKSKIAVTPQSLLGWRDSSIVQKVSGKGLGDYNLKQYDYNFDNLITYSDTGNNMGAVDWNIPANTSVHIRENIYMDGYGGTINLGENSQLFVDDNVTLTLRNVTVSSTKNFAGNPAIQLASSRSALALDNVKLDVMNDFYFNRGNLFVHNDVKFTGTSAFIYRSCQPSFIASGARLIFDTGTTFSFAPSTYTVCPYTLSRTYTSNDFIKMSDQTSKIIFNGCDFKTTLTGLRLTTGEIDFDNKVNLDSKATNTIAGIPVTAVGSYSGLSNPLAANWSPDGRFLAVANVSGNTLQILRFTGLGNPVLVASYAGLSSPRSANWSPDGKFVVLVNYNANTLQIFRFTERGNLILAGSTVTDVAPRSVNWSPDGRLLAVANSTGNTLQIFSFTGTGNPILVGYYSGLSSPMSANWSPDGRFVALVNFTGNTLQIFSVTGSASPILAGSYSGLSSPWLVDWSPDGRFVGVADRDTNTLQIFRFTGSGNPISVVSVGTGVLPFSANWSPDGRFVAVVSYTSNRLQIFRFKSDGTLVLMGSVATGAGPFIANWSPDGRFLVVPNYNGAALQIFSVNYINNTDTQNISNSIVLGNSSAGSASDVTLKLLSGANVSVDGIMNYDNVMGGTIFSNDNARFVLKDSNSKIRMNPNTVIGWQDRSLIKNLTGKGLGDYNYQTYAGADKTLTYAEAPADLVYNNSNAIVLYAPLVSTVPLNNSNSVNQLGRIVNGSSNAIMSWMKQTSNTTNIWVPMVKSCSNAIVSWIKQTSNAVISENVLARWNSNAINVLGVAQRNDSNGIVKLSTDTRTNSNAIVSQGPKIMNNSNAINYFARYFIPVNNGKITVLGGISGTTNVAGRGFLSSPIDLQGGTLTINSDMILSNQTTVVSSGNFDLQGNAMIFGGDLTLPSNVAIKVVSSGVLDGQGSEFRNAIGAKLIVDNNVSLTLRNMNWAAAGAPQIEMRTETSKLTLQNLSTNFDRDYSFTQGQLFIQDDVVITGTNKFSYASTATSYVMQHSALMFDKNTTFSYSPRVTKRHTQSERNLIKLLDKTSELYFNECTLQLPDSGWQLTKGTIYFDNKVAVYGNTSQANSFEWGNGIADGDLEIKVLSGAWLDNYGYIYHNSGN